MERLPTVRVLHADKGYDSDAIRRQVEATGAMPNIPPKANRRCHASRPISTASATPSSACSAREDFRRVATRYDRLATNFLAAVCIAATVSYWL